MAKENLAGKISGNGGQEVKALFNVGANKAPKVKTGNDLRTKKGK